MHKGIVFDIKEFSVFDGPGLRTTVFLKGCPLRCRWCHNPEGLENAPQTLRMKDGGLRLCGVEWEAEALACRLGKGKPFFAESGGGVTFSGGEPLAQWPFARDVLQCLAEVDIHTALETSGYAPDEVFLEAMEAFDLILMDIKSTDNTVHSAYTGVDNEPILRHAHMLVKGTTPFIIRLPLIPGINDGPENMSAVAALLADAPTLVRVEMLPYHQTAGAKYGSVGRVFDPGFDTHKAVTACTGVFEARGIPVTVL